jgi:hypothetical protein
VCHSLDVAWLSNLDTGRQDAERRERSRRTRTRPRGPGSVRGGWNAWAFRGVWEGVEVFGAPRALLVSTLQPAGWFRVAEQKRRGRTG